MTARKVLDGRPYVGSLHMRLEEGEFVSAVPARRGGLHYMKKAALVAAMAMACVFRADAWDYSWFDSNTGYTWTYYYTYTVREVLEIASYDTTPAISPSPTGAVTIPSKIEGYDVASIGYRAFYGCSGLTSVTIPDNVNVIGPEAFSGCKNLKSVFFEGKYAPTIDTTAFPKSCKFFVRLDSTGWGVPIPGIWEGITDVCL